MYRNVGSKRLLFVSFSLATLLVLFLSWSTSNPKRMEDVSESWSCTSDAKDTKEAFEDKEVDVATLQTFKSRVERGSRLVFTHIPKCAGTSFVSEMKGKYHLSLKNDIAWRMEQCFLDMEEQDGINLVFLRSPRTHVLSQFMECKYTDWGHAKTDRTEFPRDGELQDDFAKWIDHFHEMGEGEVTWGRAFAYDCYNPRNMQTRYLTCQAPDQHNPPWELSKPVYPHFAHETEPDLVKALLNLEKQSWIGIADLYHESVCLLIFKYQGTLPSVCKCPLVEAPSHVHNTHSVPEHHVEDVQPETLKQLDDLTLKDQGLFYHGLGIFLLDVNRAEEEAGRTFLCPGQMDEIRHNFYLTRDAAFDLLDAYRNILDVHGNDLESDRKLQIQITLATLQRSILEP